ncbi:2'-5' RNA ligase family protein [Salinimicrobium sp. TIG7-5_MAKvit]|uniref:2'-5' RNA ligase family protein n=1 Tax=Salinimicrobium sp. TIG7-5_MAKvit TaxID=3121289 RepID=UPI003C6E84CE
MAFSRALYFVAIVPPTAVKEQVKNMKLEIKEKFQVAHALKLPAHITLIPPMWLSEDQEIQFISCLRSVSQDQRSYSIALSDFGHFKQRTIFINVVSHEPVNSLHEHLLQKLSGLLPPNHPEKLHPHLTLATRDLTYKKFPKVWQEFKNGIFSAELQADALTLFKHNGKTWDILEVFPFSEKN